MAPSYNILPEEKIIVIRFQGEITGEEVMEASRVVSADERYQHGYDGIIDAIEVLTTVDREQIENLVKFSLSKRKHGYGKWVVLVNTPAATAYAMIYHKKVASKHPFSICCSLEGASDLLGKKIDETWMDKNLPK